MSPNFPEIAKSFLKSSMSPKMLAKKSLKNRHKIWLRFSKVTKNHLKSPTVMATLDPRVCLAFVLYVNTNVIVKDIYQYL